MLQKRALLVIVTINMICLASGVDYCVIYVLSTLYTVVVSESTC